MLALLIAAMRMILPLPILDARISAYRQHLAYTNITTAERNTLRQSLAFHLQERYKVMESIDDGDELLYFIS